MRDSNLKSNHTKPHRLPSTTSRKRRWLSSCLVMVTISPASVVMAENDRPLLPLPTSVDVKVNPFCLPEQEGLDPNIKLASSGMKSPLRLRKIGAVIGLHAIEDGTVDVHPSPGMLIEETPAGSVKPNPLVGTSQPNDSAQQIVANQEIAAEQKTPLIPDHQEHNRSSLLVLKPLLGNSLKKRLVEHQAVVASDANPVMLEDEPTSQQEAFEGDHFYPSDEPRVDAPLVVQSRETGLAEQLRSRPLNDSQEVLQKESEPISFRFSDQLPENDSPARSEQEVQPTETTKNSSNLASSQETSSETVRDLIEMDSQNVPHEMEDEAAMASALPLEGMPQLRKNRFCKPAEVMMEVNVDQNQHLQSKRYRPPVDVHPVPLAIEGVVAAPVFQVEPAFDTESQLVTTDEERLIAKAKVVPLYLDRAQVRSLTLGAELQKVEIANKDVCRAFAAGPNQLKLIGTGSGVTRLVVWAEPVDSRSQPRVRAFDIHVKEMSQEKGDSTRSKIAMLNESIRDAFPEVDVVVRERDGKIIVNGRCSEDAIARKIVRMVRKTCLIAVDDQLQVR